jgi:hypothetical protein
MFLNKLSDLFINMNKYFNRINQTQIYILVKYSNELRAVFNTSCNIL